MISFADKSNNYNFWSFWLLNRKFTFGLDLNEKKINVKSFWLTTILIKMFSEIEAWRPWSVDGKYLNGGHVTRYANNFTFATVRGAGHMVTKVEVLNLGQKKLKKDFVEHTFFSCTLFKSFGQNFDPSFFSGQNFYKENPVVFWILSKWGIFLRN